MLLGATTLSKECQLDDIGCISPQEFVFLNSTPIRSPGVPPDFYDIICMDIYQLGTYYIHWIRIKIQSKVNLLIMSPSSLRKS